MTPPRILVLGAGIAGLAAGWRILRESEARGRHVEVVVAEAGRTHGGSIATEKADGYLLESGPDCFLAIKPAGVELCRELGLEANLIGTVEANRRSFVVQSGRLHPVPEGFYLMAPGSIRVLAGSALFSWPGKFRMGLELFVRRRKETTDESLASFVRRRLGRECLERLAQPMIAGITTADPEKLSMLAAMPQFPEMEREHGSLIRAMRKRKAAPGTSGPRYGMFATLDGGMQILTDSLAASLGTRLRTATRVTALRPSGAGWTATLDPGGDLEAAAVVCALPAPRAAELMDEPAADVAALLRTIPFASVVTVHLGYREEEAALPEAMGFVVPAVEGRFTVAASFTSRKFPGRAPPGSALLRVFAGGATREGDADLPDDEVLERVQADLRDLMEIRATPSLVRIHRHRGAMAQYHVGHLDRVAEIERRAAKLPPFAFAGCSYRGVGVPDCIKSGSDAARGMLERLGI
ncbi:MAG: protoporphyrinogen oxidase [Planctomycetes bacterium]|nr:protoporphyrinogen oxidase [Planctomycetota bacterium]